MTEPDRFFLAGYDLGEHSLLELLKNSKEAQEQLADTINFFAALCYENAVEKGFKDDLHGVEEVILLGVESADESAKLLAANRDQWRQAEIARIGEELGEAISNIRHGSPLDDHEHGFKGPGWVVELADAMIRIGDTVGGQVRVGDRDGLGDAVVAKLLYNMGRPHKHGKQS